MKQLALNQFDLQKVKLNTKKGLDVSWYHRGNNNDLLSVESDSGPHEDFFNKLDDLRELFATVNETLHGWNHSRENNRKNDEALQAAIRGYNEEVLRWKLSGVLFRGGGDNEGIVLTGSRVIESGNVGQTSPLIKFVGELGIEDRARVLATELIEEVWKYVYKGKRGNDLFNSTEKKEDESGLNNLKAV